ncbi:hypothetical protein [Arthrobacter caoxuetaonis]|uniref:Uncharacterized protein n=1 Tax=Arthrobacter caoxuetaonis TaxID=2886935 RepID=A0A9X1SD58_9MICC|nr:hypothetical protein [Arthrobacter caoxuetaonis]MCC3299350.1 hypothetical protein [Arthrobacter caoxuetaonis]USQ59157.1 hypothetical protein NF551_18800 [Arthrobacter caoxuetaonis]
MTFTAVALTAALILAVAFLLKAAAAHEASWFASVLNATEEELIERGVDRLRTDCRRMHDILDSIDKLGGASRSRVTRPLASEQLDRLHRAMTEASRARFEAMQRVSRKTGF